MNMVRLFQKRLDVNRGNAIWRVVGFVSFLICFIASVSAFAFFLVTFFSNATRFNEEIPLLTGNHTQVVNILDGDVVVNETEFLKIMEGNKIFVSLNKETVVYMTNVAGLSYRYEQTVPTIAHVLWATNYSIKSQRIQDGMVVREMQKSARTLTFTLVLVFLVSGLMFLCVDATQSRNLSRTDYRWVWLKI